MSLLPPSALIQKFHSAVSTWTSARRRPPPLRGYDNDRNVIPYVDRLTDSQLTELNEILPWKAFVADSVGRRFGNSAWSGKRDQPQVIPDPRIELMDSVFSLNSKHVIEFGCFEGIHTVGLIQQGARVTALDARVENVVKTTVRCAFFGCHAEVRTSNIEEDRSELKDLAPDLAFHVGLLYHLRNPVQHLFDLGNVVGEGLLLDTHYANVNDASETYEHLGVLYRVKRYEEAGLRDVFSGMYGFSRWLLLEDIIGILRRSGFGDIKVHERRQERNGPRVLLTARR